MLIRLQETISAENGPERRINYGFEAVNEAFFALGALGFVTDNFKGPCTSLNILNHLGGPYCHSEITGLGSAIKEQAFALHAPKSHDDGRPFMSVDDSRMLRNVVNTAGSDALVSDVFDGIIPSSDAGNIAGANVLSQSILAGEIKASETLAGARNKKRFRPLVLPSGVLLMDVPKSPSEDAFVVVSAKIAA